MNRFPLPQFASAIQVDCPSESMAETQPQLQPALLRDCVKKGSFLKDPPGRNVTPRQKLSHPSYSQSLGIVESNFATLNSLTRLRSLQRQSITRALKSR